MAYGILNVHFYICYITTIRLYWLYEDTISQETILKSESIDGRVDGGQQVSSFKKYRIIDVFQVNWKVFCLMDPSEFTCIF